jgi:hypothetical protein
LKVETAAQNKRAKNRITDNHFCEFNHKIITYNIPPAAFVRDAGHNLSNNFNFDSSDMVSDLHGEGENANESLKTRIFDGTSAEINFAAERGVYRVEVYLDALGFAEMARILSKPNYLR